MKAFLITYIIMQGIAGLSYFISLCSADYPRIRSNNTVGQDSATLILTIALIVWAAFLLYSN